MEKKELLFVGSTALFIAIIVYFLLEKDKREKELLKGQKQKKELNQENMALRSVVFNLKEEVKEIIDKKDELPIDAKSQLKALVEEYKDIDDKIAKELTSVSNLIDIKEDTRAIMGLAKIIENIFKRLFKDDTSFTVRPTFENLIKHAKEKKIIEKEEFHFLNGIRTIRNEEAHEIAVKKSYNIISSSMLIGVEMILRLGAIIKRKDKTSIIN